MAKQISTQEITKHAQENDIWIVVNGKVYDVTEFAPDHPGGAASTMKIPDPCILRTSRAD
jgi:cytochrome b involved in lipid metabolism